MIIIIGAGLSGLLIGYRLKKQGIPFKILEARNRIGGRIHTEFGTNETPIEMGATWFNQQHENLIGLLKELEINYFKQYMDHTVFYQPSSTSPVQSVQIPKQSPSYRISGGTSNITNTLFKTLDQNDVFLNQSVKQIKRFKNSIQIIAEHNFEANRVVLAIPPKLWAKNISFEPYLPSELMDIAKQTHTWMEDSIKIALTYDEPFWEQDNLPATLFSNEGPITEFYEHCNHKKSKYALCGFINTAFKNLTYTERQNLVIHQLKNSFGTKAEAFIDYKECIWSKEKNTFVASDSFLFPHQNNGNPVFRNSFYDGKLIISSSESASEFPGYMDGAVHTANVTAEKIIKAQK